MDFFKSKPTLERRDSPDDVLQRPNALLVSASPNPAREMVAADLNASIIEDTLDLLTDTDRSPVIVSKNVLLKAISDKAEGKATIFNLPDQQMQNVLVEPSGTVP